MNERIKELIEAAGGIVHDEDGNELTTMLVGSNLKKFAELIIEDMHKKVIASILITDVVMEEKGQVPTSEDYIRAINNDFGVEK